MTLRMDRFFDLTLDLHCMASLDGHFLWCSPAFTEVLGWSEEDLLGRPFLDFVHPDDREATLEAMRVLGEGESVEDFENRYATRNGEYRWLQWRSAPDVEDGEIYATARDVTAQKRIREKLKQSRTALQEAQRIASIGSWSWNLDSGKVTWSDELYRILGSDPNEFSPSFEGYLDLIHPEDRPRVESEIQSALQSGGSFEHEVRLRPLDGDSVWIYARGRVVEHDEDGNPTRMEGTAQDVTKRREAEEDRRRLLEELEEREEQRTMELRREFEARIDAESERDSSERRYRRIVENAPLGIVRLGVHGEISTANRAFARILGYDTAANLMDAAPYEADELFVDPRAYEELLEDLENQGISEGRELGLRTKDGDEAWTRIDAVVEPADAADPMVILGFVRDITRERSLESQLGHSQKMEAIGTLAGGVAHDFNNLLTVIGSNAELILGLDDLEEIRELASEILGAVRQAQAVTSRLLIFSRKAPTIPEPVNLNEIVDDVQDMLNRLLDTDIELRTDLEDPLPSVECDRSQAEQVIMNLVLNAQDAMPGGGQITIRSRVVELSREDMYDHVDIGEGTRVLLSVTDHGIGMDEDTINQIFDPFFTTKDKGHGTGLGLSTVIGVVQGAGGHVTVYSELGEGTTFNVYLPVTDEERPKGAAEPASGDGPVGGSETILLVEDEKAVRRSTRRMLEILGYSVLTAADADDAREIWEEDGESVDLVVVDVSLPGIKGPELVRGLLRSSPDLRALFISGFAGDELVGQNKLDDGALFLTKPFSLADLAAAIRNAIEV